MPGRQVFVGRSAERDALLGLVGAASAGSPAVALVHAEAGAGKTRLIDEVVAQLPREMLVGRGAGVGFLGGRIPYAPLVAAVRSLLATLSPRERADVLGPAQRDLVRLLPELGPADADTTSDQTRLVAAVSLLLDRAAVLHPTVLVLDDLHCADVASLEVLAYVCAGLDRQRLAVLLAYRPDEVTDTLGEWLQDRRHDPDVIEVDLQPLTPAQTREQLTALVAAEPGASLAAGVLDRILVRAGGNPYAAEALLRAALAGDTDAIPAPLRDVLVRRTRACKPDTLALLRTVAVAGERVPSRVLSAVAERTGAPSDLERSVDEAVAAHLLVAEPDGDVRLRHDLLAEALYADLMPAQRRMLHRALADALERLDPRPAVVAEQADRAGDAGRALAWSARAAEAAEAVFAYDAAHQQYERVRRLWPLVPDAAELAGADAVDVFSRAAATAAICDHDTTAVEVIEQVRGWLLADPSVDRRRLGALEARYARLLLDDGRLTDALAAARRALELVPADPPTPLRADVMWDWFTSWTGRGAATNGGRWRRRRSTSLARPVTRRLLPVHWSSGRPSTRSVRRRCRTPRKPSGWPSRAAVPSWSARRTATSSTACSGPVAGGLGWRRPPRVWRRRAPAGSGSATARGWRLRPRTSASRTDGAARPTSSSRTRCAAPATSGAPTATTRWQIMPGWRRCGATGTRCQRTWTSWVPCRPSSSCCAARPWPEPRWHGGDPVAALGSVSGLAHGLTDRLGAMSGWLAWLGTRALGDLAAGPARGVHRQARCPSGRSRSRRGPGRAGLRIGRHAGRCPEQLRLLCDAELTRVAGDRSVQAWVAAVDSLQQVERPYLTAYAQWRLAQALVANHDQAAAAGPLRSAAATARALGAGPLADDVHALARRARIDLRTPQQPSEPAALGLPLTPRELEILGHLAAGRTNSEIAQALFISGKTASVHVSNILRKLGVASRYEAAELAERLDAG